MSEGETAVVVDGDVEIFPAGPADMIALAVASDAMTGAFDAGELLDVEVKKFSWVGPFVTMDRRRRGELGEAEAMATQEAGNGGLGQFGGMGNLKVRKPASAQGEHTGDAQRVGDSGGTFGTRTAVTKTGGALGAEAGKPCIGAALGDAEAQSHPRHGLVKINDAFDHLGSTQRGEFGFTMRVHAAVVLGMVSISQPHLSKSSPHEQPIGTSHLAVTFIEIEARVMEMRICCFLHT